MGNNDLRNVAITRDLMHGDGIIRGGKFASQAETEAADSAGHTSAEALATMDCAESAVAIRCGRSRAGGGDACGCNGR
jgi:hypothetical protein